MALAEPTGGAGRGTLIDALNRLKQQYGGSSPVIERGVAGGTERPVVPTAAGPPLPPGVMTGAIAGATGGTVAPPGYGGGIAPDGYGTVGWGPNGINLFNPNLARGDMPSPGPGWVLDTFGTPFYRHDYIAGPGGRPIIKGSDGYSGDYPLLTPQQLAQWGIS